VWQPSAMQLQRTAPHAKMDNQERFQVEGTEQKGTHSSTCDLRVHPDAVAVEKAGQKQAAIIDI